MKVDIRAFTDEGHSRAGKHPGENKTEETHVLGRDGWLLKGTRGLFFSIWDTNPAAVSTMTRADSVSSRMTQAEEK